MECPWDGLSLPMGLRPRNPEGVPMSTSKSPTRSSPLLSPPPIAAVLDLAAPQERATFELLLRFCTGRWPLWRLLGLRRRGHTLYAAVEWQRSKDPLRFSLAEVSLLETAVRWRCLPSALAARKALAGLDAPASDADAYVAAASSA